MDIDNLNTCLGLDNIVAFIKEGGKIENISSFIELDDNIMSIQGVLLELENKELRNEISSLFNKDSKCVCTFNSVAEDRVSFNIKVFASFLPFFCTLSDDGNSSSRPTLNILFKDEKEEQKGIYGIDKKYVYKYDILTYIKDIDNKGDLYIIIQPSVSEENEVKTSFSIIGQKYIYDIERLMVEGGETFSLKRKRIRRSNISYSNYILIKADVNFSDEITFITEYQKSVLKNIEKENASTFLDPWTDYLEERGKILVRNIKKVGVIHFNTSENEGINKDEEGKIVKRLNFTQTISDDVKKILKKEEFIDIYYPSNIRPTFLSEECVTFDNYITSLDETNKKYKDENASSYKKQNQDDEEEEEEKEKNKNVIKRQGLIDTFSLSKITNSYLDIEKTKDIPSKGFICLSARGEGVQIKRQKNALNKVKKGITGIPYLPSFLEKDAPLPLKSYKQKEVNLTPFVQEKCFKHDPTPSQLRAIHMALETPDIAIIQGPPGSGKTTVINAIVEMLNANTAKTKNIAGKVLATSYQQDAVFNMIKDDKLTINSLVTAKQGNKKSGEDYITHVESWITDIKERIRDTELDLSEDATISFLSKKMENYLREPTYENEEELYSYLINLSILSEEEKKKIEEIQKNEEMKRRGVDKSFDDEKLRKIRALRDTPLSFSDDGIERIIDIYDFILPFITDEQKEVLEIMGSEGIEGKSEEEIKKLFSCLKEMKKGLIKKFSYKPLYVQNKVNDELVSFSKYAIKRMEEKESYKSLKTSLLKSWYYLLDDSPSLLTKSILDYDFVYAATCQQSVQKNIMDRLKKVSGNSYYDTVIVDEAARATPLDLLIPLSLATKKIILVGDHRQLPQFIDDKICEQIEDEFNEKIQKSPSVIEKELKEKEDVYSSSLHLSLFQHLYEKCKKQEKIDGIKRCITLDTQFRTHPVLGNFCSNSFYEKHGEGYKSLDIKDVGESFKHNLKGIENKACIWIDVPFLDYKGEERKEKSYFRECEADAIMTYLKEYATSEESINKEYTYGIITFYKAQEELLKQKFKNLSFVTQDGKKIDSETKEKIKSRIKIGTVDSFQGMEFDFVFLSVVRSNNYLKRNRNCNPYGYLCSVNRQCVSMSRQKKALIVVGDKDFCTSKDAREEGKIKAIADFYDLCEKSEWGRVIDNE